MSNLDQENQTRQQLLKHLEKLKEYNVEELLRKEMGVELNFEIVKPRLERLYELLRAISTFDLDEMPLKILIEVQQRTIAAITLFKDITAFSAKSDQPPPATRRNQLIDRISDEYTAAYRLLQPIQHEIVLRKLEKGKDRIEIRRLEEELSSSVDNAKSKLAEIDNIKAAAQEAVGETGVSRYGSVFDTRADQHEDFARKWFWGVVGMSILTAAVSLFSIIEYILNVQAPIGPEKVLPFAIGRFLLITVLFYVLIWCTRNYSAHKHNEVINRHRQNALSTFEAFVKAAGEDQVTKNAVLLQTTQCIFSLQRGGYLKGESEPAIPNSLIPLSLTQKLPE